MARTANIPKFSPRECTACWACVEACPYNAIRKESFLWIRQALPTYHNCVGCDLCVRACPHGCFTSRN